MRRTYRIIVHPDGSTVIERFYARKHAWVKVYWTNVTDPCGALDTIHAWDATDHTRSHVRMICTGYLSSLKSHATVIPYNIDPTITIPTLW